jgi:hypothetical protein
MSLSSVALGLTNVLMLRLERIECVLHGESSHAGSIKTAKNGLAVAVEHARACRNLLRTSCGSNLRKARHELGYR